MSDKPNIMPEPLRLKVGLAEMLKGGVIMDVVTAEHARIAEDAGAVAVMALERVPADIRRQGGVARMSDPAFRHHGDADGLHDLANLRDRRHARHAAFFADV